jgi:negative regulator of replication initiation
MNISELEHKRAKRVEARESNEKETVYCIEYLNQPFHKNLRDSIIAQIGSCKQLLINTSVTNERNAIEREMLILKLIVDLLEY